MFVVFLI
ncbi:hypothetical protein LINPERPRIM_LOCUS37996 [Linum perenne]